MTGYLGAGYLWVLALHLISVIFWMAGMFMLPRFFAYHVEAEPGSDEAARWQLREARLLRIIINPAMIAAWLLGLALVLHVGLTGQGWLHVKLLLVLALSGYHGFLSRWRRELITDQPWPRTSRFYRMANEIPTLAIIPIVILAIVKPF